jgi:hypothetical protein
MRFDRLEPEAKLVVVRLRATAKPVPGTQMMRRSSDTAPAQASVLLSRR